MIPSDIIISRTRTGWRNAAQADALGFAASDQCLAGPSVQEQAAWQRFFALPRNRRKAHWPESDPLSHRENFG